MIRKQVQFTERQAARIKREAARRGISESALIRDAVDRGLGGRSGPTDEQWDRALSWAGTAHSGVADLSVRHAEYFADDLYQDHVEKGEEWKRTRDRSGR